jgi:hypothetical protein
MKYDRFRKLDFRPLREAFERLAVSLKRYPDTNLMIFEGTIL